MDFATIHEIRSRFYIKHQTPEAIADTIDYSALLEEFKALGIVFDDRGNLSWHGQKIGVLNKSYAVSLLRKMMVRIIISQFMASERLEVFDPIEQLQVVMTVMKISPEILAIDTDLHTLMTFFDLSADVNFHLVKSRVRQSITGVPSSQPRTADLQTCDNGHWQ